MLYIQFCRQREEEIRMPIYFYSLIFIKGNSLLLGISSSVMKSFWKSFVSQRSYKKTVFAHVQCIPRTTRMCGMLGWCSRSVDLSSANTMPKSDDRNRHICVTVNGDRTARVFSDDSQRCVWYCSTTMYACMTLKRVQGKENMTLRPERFKSHCKRHCKKRNFLLTLTVIYIYIPL